MKKLSPTPLRILKAMKQIAGETLIVTASKSQLQELVATSDPMHSIKTLIAEGYIEKIGGSRGVSSTYKITKKGWKGGSDETK